MSKKILNILSVCFIILIITFSVTSKKREVEKTYTDNIIIDQNSKQQTKSDEYRNNILNTVSEINLNNFKKVAKTFEKNDKDNLTDSISKDVFSQYIKYNSSGSLNEEDVLNITNNFINEQNININPVSLKDLKTISSTESRLKTYGNDVALIADSINNAINKVQNKKNPTIFIAEIYKTSANLLLKVETPDLLSQNHIQIINGYKKYSEGLKYINLQNSDPAKALIGLKMTQEATEEILSGFDKIQKTIILNNIIYNQNESGYIWIKDIKQQ